MTKYSLLITVKHFNFKNEGKDISEDLISELKVDADKLLQNINSQIQSNISSALEEYEKYIDKAKKERIYYFIVVFTVSFLLGILIYIAYLYFRNIQATENLFGTISWGVVTNAVFDVISLSLAKALDRFPGKIQKSEDSILTDFRIQSLSTIDKHMSLFLNRSDSDEADSIEKDSISYISDSLFQNWMNHLINEKQAARADLLTPFFDELVTIRNNASEVRENSFILVRELKDHISSYFSDIDSNLGKLREFSDKLKQNSVDPSFELLDSTKNILEKVKREIDEIEFL